MGKRIKETVIIFNWIASLKWRIIHWFRKPHKMKTFYRMSDKFDFLFSKNVHVHRLKKIIVKDGCKTLLLISTFFKFFLCTRPWRNIDYSPGNHIGRSRHTLCIVVDVCNTRAIEYERCREIVIQSYDARPQN